MAPPPLSPLTILSNLDGFSPVAVHDINLAKRADRQVNPAEGAKDPRAYNNVWFQLLFALIGIGMTMTALWFFFKAKNGGFKWHEDDWEDYKSTVLRRKGPDGRTLSNATKSTKLGGGSVVHGGTYGAPTTIGYTDETGTTVSEMREVEEGKSRRHFGIRGGDAEKKRKKRHEYDNDYKDRDLRDYRDERPAKVGGLNRQADGMYTDYSATGTEPSELGSNVSGRPLVKDKKSEKDQKKEDKAKKQRAIERMRKAKLAEKEAAKAAAAEAKAAKEAEKQAAKEKKVEQKKAKKAKSEAAPSEIGGPAMTEYTALESEYTYDAPKTEYTAPSEAPPRARSSRRAPPSAAYSFVTGDDQTEYTGTYTDVSHNKNTKSRAAPPSAISEAQESSYYSDYRPNAERSRASRSQSRPRQHEPRSRPSSQSPRKHHRASTSRPGASNASDIFTTANGDTRGTIAYPCHIPGLSTAGSVAPNDSVSQMGAPRGPRREERGGRDVMAGYRRGGVRTVRRDSLSDSDA